MGVNTRNNIVTDGLVLQLDAVNSKSYVSGSTTWNDLSGNSYTGTLLNGVGYSSEVGGSLSFDGSNDYIQNNSFRASTIIGDGNPFSFNIWFLKSPFLKSKFWFILFALYLYIRLYLLYTFFLYIIFFFHFFYIISFK